MALTTAFKPASTCLSDIYSTSDGPFNYLSLGPPQQPHAANQCFPSSWEATSQHFSPGICPSGYSVACQNINGAETQATCCPSFFSCQTSTDWPQYSTLACTVMVSDLPEPAPASITSGTSVYPIGFNAKGGINAFGVSIRWRKGDLEAIAERTSSSEEGPKSTDAQGDTSPQTRPNPDDNLANLNSPIPPSPPQKPDLSPGAKAGIGIGISILILSLLAIILFYLKRYRQRRRSRQYGGIGIGTGPVPDQDVGAHEILSTADVSKPPLSPLSPLSPAPLSQSPSLSQPPSSPQPPQPPQQQQDLKWMVGQRERYGDVDLSVNNGKGYIELSTGSVPEPAPALEPVELDAGTYGMHH